MATMIPEWWFLRKKLHKGCEIFNVWQWEPAPAGSYHYSCNGTYEMSPHLSKIRNDDGTCSDRGLEETMHRQSIQA